MLSVMECEDILYLVRFELVPVETKITSPTNAGSSIY